MVKKPTKKAKAAKPAGSKITLVVSDDKDVKVSVKPGTKLNVVQLAAVTPDLKRSSAFGARLCGFGTNICLAFTETAK
jgi:hypothetical protein